MTIVSPAGMRHRLTSSSSPSLRNTQPTAESASSLNNSNSLTGHANSSATNGANVANVSNASNVSRAGNGNGGDDVGDDDTRSTISRRSSAKRLSRPSLFSRMSLPLQLRRSNRHFSDFYIETAEPHRKYHAGDHVRGTVFLTVTKPIRITHLTVTLSGFVQSRKEPGVSITSHPNPPTGLVESPQYHGNGLATLFQDEQVLSGDGRLDAGKYQFGFDLLFPKQALPSSIEFERGAICYTVTATLTRPTSIAATTSCDRIVNLTDTIDIGRLPPPRPRTIFLEPTSKRTRRRKSNVHDKAPSAASTVAAAAAATASSDVNDYTSEAGSVEPSVVTEDSGRARGADGRGVDQSDIRSEVSAESSRSVSTSGLSRADLAQVASAKQQVVDDKTIVATIEMLRGGVLPGDTVTIRVTVRHVKRMKSMNGVIVTLFRQGTIDSSPSESLFGDGLTSKEKKRLKNEGVLPRSRTVLGGLSLSSSSSTSVFRKDLDQTTVPLIIHPNTLGASVTASVKIPSNAFMTIKNVPGDMISFRYQVEVIVDLGGRLSNKLQRAQGIDDQMNDGGFEANHHTAYNSRGSSIADTAPLRRERGTISVTMETIVGTDNSNRNRASQSLRTLRTTTQSDDDEAYHTEHSQPDDSLWGTPYINGQPSAHYFAPHHNGQSPRYYGPPPLPPPVQAHSHQTQSIVGPSQPYPYTPHTNGDPADAIPLYTPPPPPEIPEERNMTEKERIRQAETRLLPSQPSAATASSSAAAGDAADNSPTPNNPAGEASSQVGLNRDSSADLEAGLPYDEDETPRGITDSPLLDGHNLDDAVPSAPPLEDVEAPAPHNPALDKQEAERQRLMGEASAPPEVPDDARRQGGGGSPSGEASHQPEASAPTLDEDDEYTGYGVAAGPSTPRQQQHHHNEQLPAYER